MTVDADARVRRRGAAAAAIGSAMEFYDYALYGLSSALILNRLFFPSENPALGTALSLATFGVAFVVRPIGAVFFGHLGDRIGRRPVLVITLTLMGVATLGVGVLPTYADVGVTAPLLLIALRVCQGLGAGAEQTSASVAASEFAPPGKRGFYTSWTFAAVAGGVALASAALALVSLLPEPAFESWGWRIPFLCGGLVMAVGFYIRMRVSETPEFTALQRSSRRSNTSIGHAARYDTRTLLLAMGARVADNGSGNIVQLSFLTFIVASGVSTTGASMSLLIATTLSIGGTLLIGRALDRWGRRPLYLVGSGLTVVLAVPAFLLIGTGNIVLIVVTYILMYSVAYQLLTASLGAWLPELFPADIRTTNVALGREIPTVVTGFVPTLVASLTSLAAGSMWPAAAMLAGLGVIGLACGRQLGRRVEKQAPTTYCLRPNDIHR